MQLIRSILALEAAAFGAAALVHSGTLIQGYEHSKAATAESVKHKATTKQLLANKQRKTRLALLTRQLTTSKELWWMRGILTSIESYPQALAVVDDHLNPLQENQQINP